ncbi:DUF3267 domain-containing protein [Bacillus carboniphilus]|uniref:DUF3267 domain-containing protein n=1 Tax=Bacillus carboniphilus TaxID=86663 RepID=A0ABN0VQA5_9BACI
MHCWKSIHVFKHDGFYRMLFFSFLTMLFSFILLYSVTHVLVDGARPNEQYFSLFLLSLFILYPVHKLLHLLSFKLSGVKCRLVMKSKGKIKCQLSDPVAKVSYIGALLFPFVFITLAGFILIICFPAYFHYIVLFLALHTGLCVEDFIYLKNIMNTPKSCFIEETKDGIEILILK